MNQPGLHIYKAHVDVLCGMGYGIYANTEDLN
jgi:hypothetical protein